MLQDGEPQAIDALASCYDDTSRPPLLSYKHIQERLSLGGSSSAHMQQAAGDVFACSSGAGALDGTGSSGMCSGSSGATGSSSGGLWQQGSGTCQGVDAAGSGLLAPHHQQQQQQQLAGADSWSLLFGGLEQGQPAVTISDTVLDFGCCSRLAPSEPQTFQVRRADSQFLPTATQRL